MEKINIDMWYGDKPEQVTGLNIYFNDLYGGYSGNLRIFGKILAAAEDARRITLPAAVLSSVMDNTKKGGFKL